MKIDLKDAQVSVSSSGRFVNFRVVGASPELSLHMELHRVVGASPELSLRVEFNLSVARAEDLRRGVVEAVREACAFEVEEQERKRCKRCAGTGYEVFGEVCYAELHGVCSKCGGSGDAKGVDS